jgi:hypothetical protein
MSNQRSARLSQSDIENIREMYTLLGEMKTILEAVQEKTNENHRTLRGHNGAEGLVTRFARMEEQLIVVDGKIEAVKTSVKDVPAKMELWTRYPSLTWLVHFKFKEMSIITVAAVLLTVFIAFPEQYIGERVQVMIEYLFAKWLGI